jgi:hypothetical protein
MQFSINRAKTAAITIALLMASVALIAMPVQPIKAQEETQVIHIGTTATDTWGLPKLGPLPPGVTPDYSLDTFAYLSFRPNPIGVGQSLLVNIWTQPGVHHAFYMCDYKVTMQKPDGTQVVVVTNSYVADNTAWFEYIVDQVGTWKLKFESPGTYIPRGTYVDRPGVLTSPNITLSYSIYYKPSSTDWQELEVQEDMVASWPPSPLPTDYWTRPVNVIHREWWPILGSYPFTGGVEYLGNRAVYASNFQYTAYVQGPNSAHIVWKRLGDPATLSGMTGGQAYDYALSSTPNTPSIIFAGRCYDTVTKIVNGQSTSVWRCYDLRTGEVHWERYPATQVPTMIEYSPPTPDPTVAGAVAARTWSISLMYIGGGRLIKYNPADGAVTANVSIAPLTTGTYYMPEYALAVQTLGNTTHPIYRLINWTTAGSTINFTARVMGNISWPISSLQSLDIDAGLSLSGSLFTTWPPEVEARAQPGAMGYMWCMGYSVMSIDLRTGNVLANITSDDTRYNYASQASVADRGKVAYGAANRQWVCYDGRTGKRLWVSEQTEYPWGWAWPYARASYSFNETKGAIITSTYEGVYAIDWDDGKIIWRYTDPNAVPFEGPYSATPFFSAVTIADGKVYAYNSEHSPSLPRDRGWSLHCINATTGELIWEILNPMVPGAIADGYLTAGNPYDGYMYVFGKGKSQTTVTAPQTAVPQGTAVLIQGTVLDQSPAQPDTPCVSVASMSTQMEYVHMQMPIDGLWHNETITGVPVILTAIGSDGTVIDIGSTTTNGYYGTFSYAWTPPKEDTYTITASFAGDDSYGSSTAATGLLMGPAPASPTPTPTEQPQAAPDNTPTIIGMGIAIIIAIAIVGILMLRKRP